MKKVFFVLLFSMVLLGLYGQTRSENRWILGRWAGNSSNGINVEMTLNDNGTGILNIVFPDGYRESGDIIFSIDGNELIAFNSAGHESRRSFPIFRINDQRMVLYIWTGALVNLNKRN